ncbi:hypothetical protein [Streptomyces lunaelactis]|uniref:hypothetical protein n=1 Tax=Streptomyces lunaelactis TaxID=1535768 RepID=UPI001584816C|nr:hypothetical protein [Streptomyces lunaelactis]NUL09049.1 hypothetical protein [Streptomyces lunaelactis]
MPDPTDSAARGEDGVPAPLMQRAASSATAATLHAYRDFITHTQGCDTCIATGVDCQQAAELKQIWRAARGAAA